MSGTGIDGYRDYLARRDGDADLLNRRLAGREEFFQRWRRTPSARPVQSIGACSCRTCAAADPSRGSTGRCCFCWRPAKLNQAERFGVGLGETYGFNSGDDTPPERVYMELEEHYHTRLLAYVLDMFDLPFQVVPPPLVMRQFVKTAVFFPERPGFPFVGASKMAGCVMFDELRRAGVELFADEPDVAARIERLYCEVLTDELGHVGYCAALHRRGAGDDALAVPAYRTAVCSPNCRDQSSHRPRGAARPSRPALRCRGVRRRTVE